MLGWIEPRMLGWVMVVAVPDIALHCAVVSAVERGWEAWLRMSSACLEGVVPVVDLASG